MSLTYTKTPFEMAEMIVGRFLDRYGSASKGFTGTREFTADLAAALSHWERVEKTPPLGEDKQPAACQPPYATEQPNVKMPGPETASPPEPPLASDFASMIVDACMEDFAIEDRDRVCARLTEWFYKFNRFRLKGVAIRTPTAGAKQARCRHVYPPSDQLVGPEICVVCGVVKLGQNEYGIKDIVNLLEGNGRGLKAFKQHIIESLRAMKRAIEDRVIAEITSANYGTPAACSPQLLVARAEGVQCAIDRIASPGAPGGARP